MQHTLDNTEKALTEHREDYNDQAPEKVMEFEAPRTFDPKFASRTRFKVNTSLLWLVFEEHADEKVDLVLLPVLLAVYVCSSLDKSNLGNAKQLGMIPDIGKDPTGDKYALLNAFYFISFAPFMVPIALFAKRTRMAKVMTVCAILWGIAATASAAITNFQGAFACRFFVGLGEAGYAPVIQVYLSRFYTRRRLGTRVAIWLTMAPLGGFFNGILAYAVAFAPTDRLESWRILYLMEGLLTLVIAIIALVMLPEDIPSSKWFTDEEKEYLMYERSLDYSVETNAINWRHARYTFIRWQQLMPVLLNSCQQITVAALSAYLPTMMAEIGFKGANAQIATLAPYGAAVVTMVIAAKISDHYGNRGWTMQFGWLCLTVGFAMFLGLSPSNRAGRVIALILAECGHYIATPLINTWSANNAGNESRRAVAVPLAVSVAQAVAIGSGYLFPASDAPRYTMGSAVELGLSLAGAGFTAIYQFLIWRENKKRDRDEGGKPDPLTKPDTAAYADDAPGFRYMP